MQPSPVCYYCTNHEHGECAAKHDGTCTCVDRTHRRRLRGLGRTRELEAAPPALEVKLVR